MSFETIIIDDEPLAIEALRRFCERSGRVTVVGEATGGAAGLALARALLPAVVFLDIGMPGLSGLDVAARLAAFVRRPQIVFVTAFDHFATQAFDLSVTDYILKPLEPLRFDRALERIERLLPSLTAAWIPADEFWVPSRGGMMRVAARDIRKVEAERDYVRFHVGDRSYLLREPISTIEARLDAGAFVRIHRSTILRRDMIVGLQHLGAGAWGAIDGAGKIDRIGRSYLTTVRDRLGCPA
ncbi:LytTR family DNA-binding domain-containing protein [Sphingomonas antarctica]|uniref:LytR/AlgR family response regulator transcription factor n=1 Tax=Sphingomonas antarctica TaxID=2040274 RepID=UPI0039EA0A3D